MTAHPLAGASVRPPQRVPIVAFRPRRLPGRRGFPSTEMHLTLGLVPQLALTSYRQNQDRIDPGNVPVQRDTAVRRSPDNQFPPAAPDRPADERTVGQDLDRLHEFADSHARVFDPKPGHLLKNAVNVIKHRGGGKQAQHFY
jgi:hypothetical protein